MADTRGEGAKEGARPPIIFTEALVLKSGSTKSGITTYYSVQFRYII